MFVRRVMHILTIWYQFITKRWIECVLMRDIHLFLLKMITYLIFSTRIGISSNQFEIFFFTIFTKWRMPKWICLMYKAEKMIIQSFNVTLIQWNPDHKELLAPHNISVRNLKKTYNDYILLWHNTTYHRMKKISKLWYQVHFR